MRRSDVLKILFVCVCVCHVCPAHPCGDNPLMLVDNFSRNRGFDPESMLVYMRERAPHDYRQLMSDYRVYLECTQMVHTGYFKRSVDQNEAASRSRLEQKDPEEQFRNKFVETMRQLYDSRERDLSRNRDSFNSRLDDRNVENNVAQFVKLEELPQVIKRLLRRKLSISHIRRSRPSTDV